MDKRISQEVEGDSLGDEFLEYMKDGMTVSVDEDGTVTVD